MPALVWSREWSGRCGEGVGILVIVILNPAIEYQARGVHNPRPKPKGGFEASVRYALRHHMGRRMRDSNPRGREPNSLSKSALGRSVNVRPHRGVAIYRHDNQLWSVLNGRE